MKNIFKDKSGGVVLIQFPNWQLFLALVFMVMSRIFSDGLIGNVFYLLFLLFLVIWSIFELAQGVNLFRKLIGVTFICYVLVKLGSMFL